MKRSEPQSFNSTTADSKKSEDDMFYYRKAVSDYKLDRLQDAQESLKRAFDLEKNDKNMNKLKELEASILIKLGIQNFDMRNYEEANKKFLSASAAYQNPINWFWLSFNFLHMRKIKDAQNHAKLGIELINSKLKRGEKLDKSYKRIKGSLNYLLNKTFSKLNDHDRIQRIHYLEETVLYLIEYIDELEENSKETKSLLNYLRPYYEELHRLVEPNHTKSDNDDDNDRNNATLDKRIGSIFSNSLTKRFRKSSKK
jgi:tetratricopeptide (TPR) repeat protein